MIKHFTKGNLIVLAYCDTAWAEGDSLTFLLKSELWRIWWSDWYMYQTFVTIVESDLNLFVHWRQIVRVHVLLQSWKWTIQTQVLKNVVWMRLNDGMFANLLKKYFFIFFREFSTFKLYKMWKSEIRDPQLRHSLTARYLIKPNNDLIVKHNLNSAEIPSR